MIALSPKSRRLNMPTLPFLLLERDVKVLEIDRKGLRGEDVAGRPVEGR